MKLKSDGAWWKTDLTSDFHTGHAQPVAHDEHLLVLERDLRDKRIEVRTVTMLLHPFVFGCERLNKTPCAAMRTFFVAEAIAKHPLQPGLPLIGIHPLKKRSMRQSPEERLLDQIIGAVQTPAKTECVPHQSVPMFLEQVCDVHSILHAMGMVRRIGAPCLPIRYP